MACYKPIDAWQRDDGGIEFRETSATARRLQLPCGRCVGCRLEKSRQWATRIMHEVQTSSESCYITLTYGDESGNAVLPIEKRSLCYEDFRLFMRRLRERWYPLKKIRFYVAGEYGERCERPHFHAIIFNHAFAPWRYLKVSPSGHKLFRSSELESLWCHGFSSVAYATFESAAYCARYVMKKQTGVEKYDRIDVDSGEEYSIVPEFCQMSRMPGIGSAWLEKFEGDVYPLGRVVVNGHVSRAPRYYDKKFIEAGGDDGPMSLDRYKRGVAVAGDSSVERLAVREQCVNAKLNFLKRTL